MEQKTEASQAVDEPVLPNLPRAVGYRHTMDNTEGLKGNKPVVVFCATKPNPFGSPGLDYSASFPVTTETLFTADQMKAYARAALKAQPAPTEAAQFPNTPEIDALLAKWDDDGGTRGAAFIELRDKARQIERALYAVVEQMRTMAYAAHGNTSNNSSSSQPSGNTGELAQGEDSARLDALEKLRDIAGKLGEVGRWGTAGAMHDAIDVLDTIDRARASAETGGVKP